MRIYLERDVGVSSYSGAPSMEEFGIEHVRKSNLNRNRFDFISPSSLFISEDADQSTDK